MQFIFDLPDPAVKQRTPPAEWKAFDQFPELSGVCAFDIETHDPGIQQKRGSSWASPGDGGFICGFSVAWRGGAPFYAGTQHAGGNCDIEKAVRWLKTQMAKPDVTFVGANIIYDLGHILSHWGIDPVNAPIDVQGMAALLDERRSSYSLDSLMRDYLKRGKTGADLNARAWEIGIPNAMQNMRRLPTWIVEPYAIDDAVGTLDLYHALLPQIEEQDLTKVFELERECLLVGRDLKHRGVRVNSAEVAAIKALFSARRQFAVKSVQDLTGVIISPDDKKSIARALQVEDPSLVMETTSTGQVAVRAAILEGMSTPVSLAVREAKKMDKAISTFIEGYFERYTTAAGRIHAEFHPLRRTASEEEGGGNNGTVTGRWSSSNPNLTNIPARDPEIGPAMRRCFLPEEGEHWAKFDYSAQEPRLAVHFAHAAKIAGAQELVDRFNADPMTDLHAETAAIMGIGRTQAKIINLAILYGAGGGRIAEQLGLPTDIWESPNGAVKVAGPEAKALIARHQEAVPWVKGLQQLAMATAERRGFVKSILGRRQRFARSYSDGTTMGSHKALNSVIQPSAADQMKTAQVMLRKGGYYPLVVVHDEADFSIPEASEGKARLGNIQEIMEEAIKLSVPSVAEASVGLTWGDV